MEIRAESVTVELDHRTVMREVDLTCIPKTVTVLVGSSGSGKTTLLHCLGLLQIPTSGAVSIDGVSTTLWSDRRRRIFWRDHTTFVLQDAGIMDEETIGLNVTMRSRFLSRRARGNEEKLSNALAVTGLSGREKERAAHLSGGEKQRLAIARAIYKDAKVLFIDEPTASLDDENRHIVIDLLTNRATHGCTVIIATHDQAVIDAADYRCDLTERTQVVDHA